MTKKRQMNLRMKQNPRPREQTSHWGEGRGGGTDGRLELTCHTIIFKTDNQQEATA